MSTATATTPRRATTSASRATACRCWGRSAPRQGTWAKSPTSDASTARWTARTPGNCRRGSKGSSPSCAGPKRTASPTSSGAAWTEATSTAGPVTLPRWSTSAGRKPHERRGWRAVHPFRSRALVELHGHAEQLRQLPRHADERRPARLPDVRRLCGRQRRARQVLPALSIACRIFGSGRVVAPPGCRRVIRSFKITIADAVDVTGINIVSDITASSATPRPSAAGWRRTRPLTLRARSAQPWPKQHCRTTSRS